LPLEVSEIKLKGGENQMSKMLVAMLALVIGLSFGAVTFVQADEKAAPAPAAPAAAPAEKKAEAKKDEGKKATEKVAKKKTEKK